MYMPHSPWKMIYMVSPNQPYSIKYVPLLNYLYSSFITMRSRIFLLKVSKKGILNNMWQAKQFLSSTVRSVKSFSTILNRSILPSFYSLSSFLYYFLSLSLSQSRGTSKAESSDQSETSSLSCSASSSLTFFLKSQNLSCEAAVLGLTYFSMWPPWLESPSLKLWFKETCRDWVS